MAQIPNVSRRNGFVLGLCFALLAGCTHAPLVGGIYSDVASGVAATSNTSGNRVGEACANSWFWLVAMGDASIEAARRNGGITMISSVDQEDKNILFVYQQHCTTVRGR